MTYTEAQTLVKEFEAAMDKKYGDAAAGYAMKYGALSAIVEFSLCKMGEHDLEDNLRYHLGKLLEE